MPASTPATRDYQRAQVALRALTYKDVIRLWALLDPEKLDDTFPRFAAATLHVIRQRREASVAFARAYLTALRAGVEGEAPNVAPTPFPAGDALTSLRFSSVVSIKSAMTRGTPLGLASRNALVLTMGAADRLINDGGRELIRASVEADPAAQGWVRVTLGTCDYCAEQASGNHMQAGNADFPRHDHCGCVPEPRYEDALQPEEEYVQKITGMIERGDATEDQLRAMLRDPNIKPLSRINIEEALARLRAKAEAKVVEAAEETVKEAALEALQAQPGDSQNIAQAVDALMPRSGAFSTATREKTAALLKQTPEGRNLLETMSTFQSGGKTAIPRLRSDIEKYLSGIHDLSPGRVQTIENFLSAVRSADAGSRKLYRGMQIPGELDEIAARYAVGSEQNISLASFSSDRGTAYGFAFAKDSSGAAIRGAKRVQVILEWEGEGKRALPIQKLAKNISLHSEKEWVGAGKFQIIGSRRQWERGKQVLVLKVKQAATW